jgi:hypothetical protein
MLPLGAFFLLSAFVSSSLAAPHLKVISDSWGAAYEQMKHGEFCGLSILVIRIIFPNRARYRNRRSTNRPHLPAKGNNLPIFNLFAFFPCHMWVAYDILQ